MTKLWQFSQRHPRPAFSEKVQRGTRGNFSTIARKVALVWKVQKHSGANNIILYLVCTWSAKTGKDFGAKKRLQKGPNGQVMAIQASSPKTRIFWKVQRSDQRKFFKNRPKSSPRLKGPKAHWRKWHYPLISMHLKCKDWKRFRRKQRH